MTTKSLGKIARGALWLSPFAIAIAAFFGLLLWLKPRNVTFVLLLGAVFAIFVLGYSSFLARRLQRRLDEVQIASQGFASFRGYVWGAGVTTLLLMLPPVPNLLIDLADRMTTGSPDTSNRSSVLVGLSFGFMLLLLMQMACIIVASAIWQRRMDEAPEQP